MSIVRIQCTEIWAPPAFDLDRDYSDQDQAYTEAWEEQEDGTRKLVELNGDSTAERYYDAIGVEPDLDLSTYERPDRRPLCWLDANPTATNADMKGYFEPLEPRRRRTLAGKTKPTADIVAIYRNGGRYRNGRYQPRRSSDFRDRTTLQDWEDYLTYLADQFLIKKAVEEFKALGGSTNVASTDRCIEENNKLFKTRSDSPPPMCSHEDPTTGAWIYMGPPPGSVGAVYTGRSQPVQNSPQ